MLASSRLSPCASNKWIIFHCDYDGDYNDDNDYDNDDGDEVTTDDEEQCTDIPLYTGSPVSCDEFNIIL